MLLRFPPKADPSNFWFLGAAMTSSWKLSVERSSFYVQQLQVQGPELAFQHPPMGSWGAVRVIRISERSRPRPSALGGVTKAARWTLKKNLVQVASFRSSVY